MQLLQTFLLRPKKLFSFYHQRQRIEAGFKELKQHYYLQRLPFKALKANEFWIICKIIAMTMFKIFQFENFPKALRCQQRKTFLRNIFQKGLRIDINGKVEVAFNGQYTWHLKRLFNKMKRIELVLIAEISDF